MDEQKDEKEKRDNLLILGAHGTGDALVGKGRYLQMSTGGEVKKRGQMNLIPAPGQTL